MQLANNGGWVVCSCRGVPYIGTFYWGNLARLSTNQEHPRHPTSTAQLTLVVTDLQLERLTGRLIVRNYSELVLCLFSLVPHAKFELSSGYQGH